MRRIIAFVCLASVFHSTLVGACDVYQPVKLTDQLRQYETIVVARIVSPMPSVEDQERKYRYGRGFEVEIVADEVLKGPEELLGRRMMVQVSGYGRQGDIATKPFVSGLNSKTKPATVGFALADGAIPLDGRGQPLSTESLGTKPVANFTSGMEAALLAQIVRDAIRSLQSAAISEAQRLAGTAVLKARLAETPDRLVPLFERALSLEPDNLTALVGLAAILEEMPGGRERAADLANRALRIDPNNRAAQHIAYRAEIAKNDRASATPLDLRSFKFEGPLNLTKGSLVRRNLTDMRVDFVRADEADLSGADLTGSQIGQPQLPHWPWEKAPQRNLPRSSFRTAKLVSVKLDKVGIDNASFIDADLRGASLRGARLRSVSFERVALDRSDWRDLSLSESEIRHSTLEGVVFGNTQVSGVVLENVRFVDGQINGLQFNGELRNVDLSRVVFGPDVFVSARYDCQTKLPVTYDPNRVLFIPIEPVCNGKPTRRDFTGTEISGDYTGLNLRGAVFRNRKDLLGWFAGSDLTGADLRGAWLGRDNERFKGADLTNADLRGAEFGEAGELTSCGGWYGGFFSAIRLAKSVAGAKLSGVKMRLGDFGAEVGSDPVDPGRGSVLDLIRKLQSADLSGAILVCSGHFRETLEPWQKALFHGLRTAPGIKLDPTCRPYIGSRP